jgi:hypothetical protein
MTNEATMGHPTKPLAIDDVISIGTRRQAVPYAQVGSLVDIDADGTPRVEYPGNTAGPLSAILAVPLDEAGLRAAAAAHAGAVLVFDGGNPLKPVLVGLVQAPGRPATDPAATEAIDIKVDGENLSFCAQNEIEFRCGDASITLRRNGKIVIRGAFVESHATGTNRIKGATVKVN